jgi:hypothetical protein
VECAAAITPGYALTLETPLGELEARVSEGGEYFWVILGDGVVLAEPRIVWQRSGGFAGICQTLAIDAQQVYLLRDCSDNRLLKVGRHQDAQVLAQLTRFGDFQWQVKNPPGSADMFQDEYIFHGTGTELPSLEEQQQINEMLAVFAGSLERTAPESASGAAPVGSGIEGQALVSPACPGPESVDNPCPPKPYQAGLLVLDSSGQQVASLRPDLEGRFRLALAPGSYTLRPEETTGLGRTPGQTVEVAAGEYTRVEMTIDSGIR